MTPWYTIQNIDAIDSPALVVFPDRIQKNIDLMIEIAGSPQRLRPHVKTYKMTEIVKMQMAAGIQQFKCATIAEGEMLGNAGAPDVLLAYQPVGPKIYRLLELVKKFPATKFSALVDSTAAAQNISAIFSQKNKTLEVWLDLDVGMHRTGIAADESALELFKFCKKIKSIDPVGLHIYDGHLRDSDFEKRKKKSDTCFEMVRHLIDNIKNAGFEKPQIVAGGSPTFTVHALREEVGCSPGTCLLWDFGYDDLLPEQNFNFAALVVSRIISKPASHLLCVDLGHKSVAAEKPFPRVRFLNLPEAKQIEQSEEHLVLEVGDNSRFEIGQVLYGVPKHICPTCALYKKAYVIRNTVSSETWQVVSRDRMISI